MSQHDAENLKNALSYVRNRFGFEIFENPERIFSAMLNLFPNLKRDGNVLRQMSKAGLMKELFSASETGDKKAQSQAIMKARHWLTDYLMLSDEGANYYISALNAAYRLDVKPTPPQPKRITRPQSAPTTKIIASGRTGDCAWIWDNEGVLTISGHGRMGNYPYYRQNKAIAPWRAESLKTIRSKQMRSKRIYSVIIEDGVTSIGDFAFSGCSDVSSVRIPDSVTSIGNHAFSGCSSLTSVRIPDSVTSIGNHAFSCCSMTSVRIPDSVTSIGEGAFSGCSSLTSVRISDSVTNIGKNAFSGCSSLTSVRIPDSVSSIGDFAFSDCSNLKSVRIPDSVTSIEHFAFADCSNLKSVSVPRRAVISGAFEEYTTVTRR